MRRFRVLKDGDGPWMAPFLCLFLFERSDVQGLGCTVGVSGSHAKA